jgi:hypothetical protein
MTPLPPHTSTPIRWSIQTISFPGISFPVARLSFQFYGATILPSRRVTSVDCWLDTGAPLSVVPYHVHNQRLSWKLIPGIHATWSGQPCDLGRVDIWLPTDRSPYIRGPLSLLAKFARRDPPGNPMPVLLGLEFFLTHQAEFHMLLPPQTGILRVPGTNHLDSARFPRPLSLLPVSARQAAFLFPC